MNMTLNMVKLAVFVAAVTSVLAANPSTPPSDQDVTGLDLGGQWKVSATGSNDWFAATVPGCVHTDLLAAKRIPDPFYRDNEKRVQWVSDLGWTYRREFQVSDALLAHSHLLLRCAGLDTLATVYVNGVPMGKTDNMYRLWEYDVKSHLKLGANTIEIQFESVLPLIRGKELERKLPTWQYPGAGYIRKLPCNFGWDWGPTLITCGIWRDISLVAYNTARLNDVQVLQDHSTDGKVRLTFNVSASPVANGASSAWVSVSAPNGSKTEALEIPLHGGSGSSGLVIQQPEIWWPVGMGKQPLYTVHVELKNAKGKRLDATQKRIGLRTMWVLEGTKTKPMQFVVNGVPYFAKGANWIPADTFPNRITKEQLRRYVADAVAVNMNSLRFWGGGYYEEDDLFDACDEMGICVWLDFKFACSTYPVFDDHFMENVRQEAVEQVKRLRHHPSIAVWCGNNEIGMGLHGGEKWSDSQMSTPDYYKLFADTIRAVARSQAPQTDCVTGSPDCGDVHYWDVWHGGKPFEAYRDIHGFISEFGFQSFPVPATVDSFTAPEDRTSVYSPIIKHHERSNRPSVDTPEDGTIGTDKIMKIVKMNFGEPKDYESSIWLSQINQAYGIEFAAEGWRREMPKSTGCVYWQYNDTWPGTSWSSVDYFGRWKALQYRARHFYAPVLVSGCYNISNNVVALWLTSDQLKPIAGKLSWQVTDMAGAKLRAGKTSVAVDAQQSRNIGEINIKDLVQKHGASNLLVWLTFDLNGQAIASYTLPLVKPKDLPLRNPNLTSEVTGSGTNYTVSVRAKHPALWVWLDVADADAKWSDNFVPVAAGKAQEFTVKLSKPLTKEAFVKQLKVRSLFDTRAP